MAGEAVASPEMLVVAVDSSVPKEIIKMSKEACVRAKQRNGRGKKPKCGYIKAHAGSCPANGDGRGEGMSRRDMKKETKSHHKPYRWCTCFLAPQAL